MALGASARAVRGQLPVKAVMAVTVGTRCWAQDAPPIHGGHP